MLSLILLIAIGLIFVGIRLWNNDDMMFVCAASLAIGILSFIVCTILLIICTCNLSTSSRIDEKLSMYEEENQAIETRIEETINDYLDYEQDTYSKMQIENPVNAVIAYPELSSSALVQQQIETYNNNVAQIKELKEDKIDLSVDRFMIYFGH